MGDRRPIAVIRRAGAVGLGVVIGLAALEGIVRPFASVQLPPVPDIARDDPAGALVESRQIEEGVQTSHFTRGGSRWTGTPPAADAPTLVIIGDSYVVAREVADHQTMGAWVERLSRDDGRPTTVRQYGWRAARPAQYVHVAPDVIRRWSPVKVIVVLGDNDFDARALTDTMESPPPRNGLLDRSSLVMLVRHRQVLLDARAQRSIDRWKRRLQFDAAPAVSTNQPMVILAAKDDPAPTVAPADIEAAVVRELARAYGSRLAIVYVANTRTPGDDDANERRLRAACAARGVAFMSTRNAMQALEGRGVIPRGFSTTTLGSGHLNADGHEMMGRLIWSTIRSP